MNYIGYICYYHDPEGDEIKPVLLFEQPNNIWEFEKVISISFSFLVSWTDKDKDLYRAE